MAENFAPARQLFSVPYNFILYMTENPALPRGLKRLYKTCKFFLVKSEIVLINFLVNSKRGISLYETSAECVKIKGKFWPINYLKLQVRFDQTRFFRISIKRLHANDLVLSRPEFEFIVAEKTIKHLIFIDSKIEDMPIEEILEKLPAVINFWYANPDEIYSMETFKKLNSIQRNPKLNSFRLKISKSVSFSETPSLLFQFMLHNCTSHSRFHFQFEAPTFPVKNKFRMSFRKLCANNPNIFDASINPDDISVSFK